ncbi:transposase [Paenibacillus larvae]|nr:transposase [Paenibacillus larvae]MDT2237636.1 transposase [Paenibacillus larvae]
MLGHKILNIRGVMKWLAAQINVDSQLLHQLFLGNSQDAGVAKLLESVLNQVLQAQVSEQVEADRYERTGESKKRTGMDVSTWLHTGGNHYTMFRASVVGSSRQSSLVVTREAEQALILAMMEMVVNGVSTRKVSQVTEELCGTEFKSTVSDSL